MAVEIIVPTLGESVTEATVAKWLKAVGDAVAVDEPLVELETDKVTLEVNAAGRRQHRRDLAGEGATVAGRRACSAMIEAQAPARRQAARPPAAAPRRAAQPAPPPAAAGSRRRPSAPPTAAADVAASRPAGAQAGRGEQRSIPRRSSAPARTAALTKDDVLRRTWTSRRPRAEPAPARRRAAAPRRARARAADARGARAHDAPAPHASPSG